jgi:hypothetical protein
MVKLTIYNFEKVYLIKSILRFKPSNLVLLTAEFLNTVLKVSSVISSQSFLVIDNSSGFGLKSGSLWDFENLFQGQTS